MTTTTTTTITEYARQHQIDPADLAVLVDQDGDRQLVGDDPAGRTITIPGQGVRLDGLYPADYLAHVATESDLLPIPPVEPVDVEQIVAALNAYDGENVWEDLIRSLPIDEEAIDAADPSGRSDVVVLTDGTTIVYDEPISRWVTL